MAFKQSFFLVLVLLASSVVLGKAEAGEAAETTNAVKTASRKMLPIGGQLIKMLGVGVDDGLEIYCALAGENCISLSCCLGCTCVTPYDAVRQCTGRC